MGRLCGLWNDVVNYGMSSGMSLFVRKCGDSIPLEVNQVDEPTTTETKHVARRPISEVADKIGEGSTLRTGFQSIGSTREEVFLPPAY